MRLLLLTLALLGILPAGAAEPPAGEKPVLTGNWIIKLQVPATGALIQQVSRILSVRVIGARAKGPYLLVRPLKGGGFTALGTQELPIELLEPEYVMKLLPIVERKTLESPSTAPLPRALDARSVPNDPYFRYQWGMQDGLFGIGLPTARARTRGAGVIVAILDTGVRQDAPDLVQTKFMSGLNVIANNALTADDNGHGTHVCGTIAQSTDNSTGCAGIAPAATVLPVKVLNAKGQGSNYSIGVGIRYAVDKGAKIINMSIGGVASQTLADAIEYARNRNVILCCAAGNSGLRGITYPAAYPGVLAVGASTATGVRASFSQYGPGLSLVAPGAQILQQTFGQSAAKFGYYYFSGTSMATPMVSGACANVLALNPSLSADGVRTLLMATARDLGPAGWDEQYGAGLLNLAAACERAGGTPPSIPTTPIPPVILPPPVPPVDPVPPLPPVVPPPVVDPGPAGLAGEVVALFNVERAAAGLAPLSLESRLTAAAVTHAADMRAHATMSHTGSDGSNPGTRIGRTGYTWATYGECIAMGQPTPGAVTQAWMNSPPHRAIILGIQFTQCGIAKDGAYWAAVFARPR